MTSLKLFYYWNGMCQTYSKYLTMMTCNDYISSQQYSHNAMSQQDLDMHCFKLKQNGNNLW